jgi:hypothetical protein
MDVTNQDFIENPVKPSAVIQEFPLQNAPSNPLNAAMKNAAKHEPLDAIEETDEKLLEQDEPPSLPSKATG